MICDVRTDRRRAALERQRLDLIAKIILLNTRIYSIAFRAGLTVAEARRQAKEAA